MSLNIINEKLKKIKIIEKNINYKYNPSFSNEKNNHWKRHIYFKDLKSDLIDEISSYGFSYYNILPSKLQRKNKIKFHIHDKYGLNYIEYIKKNPKLLYSNSNLLMNKNNIINTNNNNNNNNNNNKIIKKHIFTKSSLNIFSRPKINNNNFNTFNNKNNNNNKNNIFKEYEKINNNNNDNNINNYKEKQITYSLNLTRNSFLLKRQNNGNFYTIFNPNKIIESNREKENNLLDEKIKEMKRNKRFKIKKNLFNICNSTSNIFSNSNSQRKKNLKKFTFRNIRNSTNYDSKDNLYLEYLENYPKSLFKSAKIYHTKNNKNEINENNKNNNENNKNNNNKENNNNNNKIKKRNIFHNNKLKQALNFSK